MSRQLGLLKNILEAALMASDHPLSVDRLQGLFSESWLPTKSEIRTALKALQSDYETRGVQLNEVASGYRFQANSETAEWVSKLWEERPPRYSRALLETLSLIAYRQPVTRAEIEDVRGVAVSSNIIKTLLEREWVQVIGHRDVPGKPALYATTREFLDYFNLKGLDQLPTLMEIRDLETIGAELQMNLPETVGDKENDLVDAAETEAFIQQEQQMQVTPATVDRDE